MHLLYVNSLFLHFFACFGFYMKDIRVGYFQWMHFGSLSQKIRVIVLVKFLFLYSRGCDGSLIRSFIFWGALCRDKRARLQLRKQRRATTSRGSLRSVSKDAHLTPTLKSNLAVEGCWRAFLPALGSVAELMGMQYQNSVFSLLELLSVCIISINIAA